MDRRDKVGTIRGRLGGVISLMTFDGFMNGLSEVLLMILIARIIIIVSLN